MRKYKLKSQAMVILYFIICLFLEVCFRLLTNNKIFNVSLWYVILFSLFISLLLSIINTSFSPKINKTLFFISLIILGLLFSLHYCIFKIFGFYFDLSLLKATDQVMEFASDGVKLVLKNIGGVLLFFIPLILLGIFHKNLEFKRRKVKLNLLKLIPTLMVYILLLFSYKINKTANKLYFKINNIELCLKNFGVINTSLIDLQRHVLGFQEEITFHKLPKTKKPPKDPQYHANNLLIDFDSLIENSPNNTIRNMHLYFKGEEGSLQNKYTGFFKNKNLILFMGESFNEIAVDEKLTPTLYKLVNNGFVFRNYYTPLISSTLGGEFQELTGLVAATGFIDPWKAGGNAFPFGIANVFKKANYNTFAYHDHSYTFQNRYKYLPTLGFDNFLGCGNGLEKRMNCWLPKKGHRQYWPESDEEMIEATFNDYALLEKPFLVYYVTVSGHGGYSWGGNQMSRKHKEEVINLPYSDGVKAYIAANIELDKALELLINKLTEQNILDDTVIALVGDHYPYMLDIAEINEVIPNKDSVIEVNHSNFILWNNKMSNVYVDKVGSQIDVLPTLYNLFGISYDSRLIIGKDILSPTPGLAIFGNRSWVSDKGRYFSAKGKFVPKKGQKISDDYVLNMNRIVDNKINMSKLIMQQNYYKYFK